MGQFTVNTAFSSYSQEFLYCSPEGLVLAILFMDHWLDLLPI